MNLTLFNSPNREGAWIGGLHGMPLESGVFIDSLRPSDFEMKGKAHLQVLRSAPQPMVAAEAKVPGNPNAKHKDTENHIQRTMLRLIEKASSFIYIENQFFVSAFGEQVPTPSPRLSPAARYINSYYGTDQNGSAQTAALFDDDKRWFSADLAELTAPPQNPICRALIQRIRRAIFDITKPDFHVYITLPVHPEGELAKASVAVQVYWTMQSLAHGSHSLINGIRRALKARDYLDKNPRCELRAALQWADELPVSELDPDDERWKNYLTLLNLRNWEKLGERYVTEQIYVHSKLMIVDDLYALLGSANINDRSLLGTRDSELAVLVMDGENTLADLCGNGGQKPVRLFAHDLRKAIWKKLFGITGGVRPASELQSAIDAPASPKSWQAIQERAEKNAQAYEAAFPFVPRNWVVDKLGKDFAKIIPNWDRGQRNPQTGGDGYPASRLPFEPEFWSAPQHDPKGVAQLESIRGFITALPIHWIEGENVRFDFPSSLVTKDDRVSKGTLMSEADVGIGRG